MDEKSPPVDENQLHLFVNVTKEIFGAYFT